MTLRWRYFLAIVPLFTGLGIANALVLYFLGQRALVWGSGEQAKGAALTIAAFADPAAIAGPAPPADRRAAYEQFGRRLGGMSAAWFVETSGRWQATPLIATPGLRLPATPDAATVEFLRRREAVALLVEQPGAPHDEAVGYAGVFGDDGRLRGLVGATVPETAFRARRQDWVREGVGLVALLALLGWGIAEALTQLARRELDGLQAVGDALSRGDYSAEWTPGRIGELNDLGGTLRTVASLLRDSVHRTRRKLLQVNLFPRDLELAALWHQTCDATPDIVTPHARVLLRRIGGRHPDDFFGGRETPHHWIAVAGRLDPAPGTTALARILNSTTARDYFLGLGVRAAAAGPPAGPCLLPTASLDLLVIPKDGRPATWWRAPAPGAAPVPQRPPAARGVAGTLPREARQFAADFLHAFPPAELPLRADELSGLWPSRGEGVLLVYAFGDGAFLFHELLLPPPVPAIGTLSGLRFKVLLGLTVFNIAVTLIFSVNHYFILKSSIIDRVNDQLSDFATTLPELLPEGYLDRAVTSAAVTPEEYRRIVDRLTQYCNQVGLRYLYSYAERDKGFYCTSSNGTAKEMAEQTFAKYWELYKDAPREITEAWTSGEVRSYLAPPTDQYGECYALFVRKQTAAGTRYIAGADLSVEFLNHLLEKSLLQSVLLGAAVFACFFVVSFFVASRFSSRIVQLAAYTRELAGSDFRLDAASPLRQQVVAIPQRTKDEVGQLASSFLVMEDQLDTYLRELKETMAAKERFQNELKIAGDIQAAMLPHEYPSSDRLDLHAAMKPAKEAGGDLYDCFFLDPEHLCFVIGDVSDKGMPAALFMAVTLTIVRAKATAALADAPEEILRQTNELLVTQNQMYQFVTMLLGVLNVRTGLVVYSDGGHNRPYHRSAAAAQMIPRGGGIALGVMPGAAFKRHTLQLQPGETLFLYTDGVTEAIAADESFYGEARLETLLSAMAFTSPAAAWVDGVMKNVFEFSHGHVQADDITVLAVRFKP